MFFLFLLEKGGGKSGGEALRGRYLVCVCVVVCFASLLWSTWFVYEYVLLVFFFFYVERKKKKNDQATNSSKRQSLCLQAVKEVSFFFFFSERPVALRRAYTEKGGEGTLSFCVGVASTSETASVVAPIHETRVSLSLLLNLDCTSSFHLSRFYFFFFCCFFLYTASSNLPLSLALTLFFFYCLNRPEYCHSVYFVFFFCCCCSFFSQNSSNSLLHSHLLFFFFLVLLLLFFFFLPRFFFPPPTISAFTVFTPCEGKSKRERERGSFGKHSIESHLLFLL